MAHALRIAARGLGRTWPNPAVGCVIVRDGIIVGRGWTQPGGRPHAEVMALAQAGAAAQGATAYVTLEPCAHHGKTAPCAEALIAAGVARVVSALQDPDPRGRPRSCHPARRRHRCYRKYPAPRSHPRQRGLSETRDPRPALCHPETRHHAWMAALLPPPANPAGSPGQPHAAPSMPCG